MVIPIGVLLHERELRPRAKRIRVTMLVPFCAKITALVIKTSAVRIEDNTASLRKKITILLRNLPRYRFGLADAGILFIGIGSFPSAPLVSARKECSERMDSKTASTRASIISFSRTAW